MSNEALCRCCYVDTKGHPTIGIGYNLDQPGADVIMRRYGLNVTAVKQDCYEHTAKHCLTQANALDLFNTISYPDKVGCVDRFVSGLPPTVKAAVVDMAFGGCSSLQGYHKMKDALMKRDWKRAADESTESDWCGIVGAARCQMDHRCIASGSKLIAIFNKIHI